MNCKPIKITENVYWVGAIDWNVRDFHGYHTPLGSTYNAYLILDEKVTLIDTVKAEFAEDLLAAVSQLVDPRSIEIVIEIAIEFPLEVLIVFFKPSLLLA